MILFLMGEKFVYLCHPKLVSGSLKETQDTSKRFRNKFGMTQFTTKRKFGHSKPHLTQKHTTKPPNVFPTKKASRRTNWQLNFFGVPKEIRTPVERLKASSPRPLDDGDI